MTGRSRVFADRRDAGRALAAGVAAYLRDLPPAPGRPLVLALPRGGVPVGFEVADVVDADLDVTVVRKIGAPGRPELGVGAVAEDEEAVFDDRHLAHLRLRRQELTSTVEEEIAELRRRVRRYRGDRPAPRVGDRVVIVVDDGLATGATARAALRSLRRGGPRRLVMAVPVCAADAASALAGEADAVLCVARPEPFRAVGAWYADFTQTTDDEVVSLLARARAARTMPAR